MSRGTKVDTMARLARWKIEGYTYNNSSKISNPFRMGIWNWHLRVAANNNIWLFPQQSKLTEEQPPLARFIIRVTTERRRFTSPVHEKLLRKSDDFDCLVDFNLRGHFIVEVEFLNLKINGSTGSSIWPTSECTEEEQYISTGKCISRLLKESIHMDVTINASGGTLRAHKAILCLSSPVFEGMFRHDLNEKESSTVDIQDMSFETCTAMLGFMYGYINQAEFWKHRTALLGVADKYDVVGLKDACEKSLLEDVSAENVLERLQDAWLYSLQNLKKGCMAYLLDFGKIYDVDKDKMCLFFRQADRELVEELFQGLLLLSKPAA